ncbi:MAG: nuclear transport factor 2 family protein [Solirubrobacterales bacterium]
MGAPDDDRIRAVYEAFNERGEIDTELFRPDVEWHNAPEWPGASVHRGIEAVRRDIARQREAWDEARYEPVEVLRTGDKIVVLLHVVVKGKASGVPAGMEGAHVLTLRDGKVARVQAFMSREQALAAAGLASG